jgi:hypothetical protein
MHEVQHSACQKINEQWTIVHCSFIFWQAELCASTDLQELVCSEVSTFRLLAPTLCGGILF